MMELQDNFISIILMPVISNWPTIIIAIIAGIFALNTYIKSTKIKAGELLMELEKQFTNHIPILLDIEYLPTYKSKIIKALYNAEHDTCDEKDDKVIEQLDLMLRHFHTICQLKKIQIDEEILLNSYSYYFNKFNERPELVLYLSNYWKTVHYYTLLYKNKENIA